MSGIAQVLYQQWVLMHYLLQQQELRRQATYWSMLPYLALQKEES